MGSSGDPTKLSATSAVTENSDLKIAGLESWVHPFRYIVLSHSEMHSDYGVKDQA